MTKETTADVVAWINGNIARQRRVERRRRALRQRAVSLVATIAAAVALIAGTLAVSASAGDGPAQNTPTTTATDIHGTPGNNPGHSNEAQGACPAGAGADCDGGMHGIANVVANGGRDDEPPACDAHGGLGTVNQNCVDG